MDHTKIKRIIDKATSQGNYDRKDWVETALFKNRNIYVLKGEDNVFNGNCLYPNTSSRKKLCHHFERVPMSLEQGIKNNIPIEEFRWQMHFYENPSHIEAEYEFRVKVSLLHKISDTKCQCSKCQREFSVENMDKMIQLFARMNELESSDLFYSDLRILKLCEELEPTWYQLEEDDRIKILEVEKDPRKWSSTLGEFYIDNFYDNLKDIAVLQLPHNSKLGGRNRYACNHYEGTPYVIGMCEQSCEENEIVFPRSNYVGSVKSLLFTNHLGVCKCQKCRKVFSFEEQQQLERLVEYLNTPHYSDGEAVSYHNQWKEVFDFYDKTEYLNENEPYKLLRTEKILELSSGIEPVVYRETHNRNKAEIIKKLIWNGEEWEC